MEYRDYYATLGVPRTASQADIKKAFRKLAREHHPDVNKGDAAAEQRFKEVNEANEVLSDPEKRKAVRPAGRELGGVPARRRRRRRPAPRSRSPASAAPARPGGVRFEFHGDPEDLAGFSDFFRTFFAGATPGGARRPAAGARATSGWTRDEGGTGDRPASPSSAGIGGDSGDVGTARQASARAGRAGRARTPPASHATPPWRPRSSLEEVATGTERLVQVGEQPPRGAHPARRRRRPAHPPLGQGRHGRRPRLPHRPRAAAPGLHARRRRTCRASCRSPCGEALLGAEVPVETLNGRGCCCASRPGRRTGASSGSPARACRASGRRAAATSSSGRASCCRPRLDEEGPRLARALHRPRRADRDRASSSAAARHLTTPGRDPRMKLDRYTEKAQEAILAAQRLATDAQSPVLDAEHLLAALLEDPEGIPAVDAAPAGRRPGPGVASSSPPCSPGGRASRAASCRSTRAPGSPRARRGRGEAARGRVRLDRAPAARRRRGGRRRAAHPGRGRRRPREPSSPRSRRCAAASA